VFVCVRERGKERESVCSCMHIMRGTCVCVCVCVVSVVCDVCTCVRVHERERDRECVPV